MADASYPDDRLYHSEHDWARVEGEHATLGITWYAQDALGEVVFFEPPPVGTSAASFPCERRCMRAGHSAFIMPVSKAGAGTWKA